ncbi:methyltransferase [Auriculariales sp. MPI-PUGE-AT-0066]|nr:methyltransferase [Auriculariales sp. MPI-PUGE-AT-0066]
MSVRECRVALIIPVRIRLASCHTATCSANVRAMDGDELDGFEPVHETDLAIEPPSGPARKTKELKNFSSVYDRDADAPPFGARFLTSEEDVWSKNAWDHVPAPEGYEGFISDALNRQREKPVNDFEKAKCNGPGMAARNWDIFYKNNQGNFFRDRKWLNIEFPQLIEATKPEAGELCVLEVGCGAGNTALPLLSDNQNPDLKIFACDFSPRAVELVKSHELYSNPPAGSIHASVWDLTSSDSLPEGIPPGSVDIVFLVFVLSALQPSEWAQAVKNLHRMLKPGGHVLFRDYGRHDLAQLRFKGGRLLEDNFYIRGDKTRVYFFELEELEKMFCATHPETGEQMFAVANLGVDRRLLVNRKRQLKMYRVWMQGRFCKQDGQPQQNGSLVAVE